MTQTRERSSLAAWQIGALVLFAAFTVWIHYEVNYKLEHGSTGAVDSIGQFKLRDAAPDFSLPDVAGTNVALSSFRGKKVVLLDFWATWCGPCLMAMPKLQALLDTYGSQGLEILSINQREAATTVAPFMARKKYGLHALLDLEGLVGDIYGVRSIPTLILIDKQGLIQRIQIGYGGDESDLETAVKDLLKK